MCIVRIYVSIRHTPPPQFAILVLLYISFQLTDSVLKLHYCVAIIHVTHILDLKQTGILSIVKWLGNGHLPYSGASHDQTDESARFHLQQSRMFNVHVNYVDTCNNGQRTSL